MPKTRNKKEREVELEDFPDEDEPCCTKKTKRQLCSICLLSVLGLILLLSSKVPDDVDTKINLPKINIDYSELQFEPDEVDEIQANADEGDSYTCEENEYATRSGCKTC